LSFSMPHPRSFRKMIRSPFGMSPQRNALSFEEGFLSVDDLVLLRTMKVKVHLLPTKKEHRVIELRKGASVEEAIRALGLYPDAWIAVRGDEPLPLDEALNDGDELKLVSVVSGG